MMGINRGNHNNNNVHDHTANDTDNYINTNTHNTNGDVAPRATCSGKWKECTISYAEVDVCVDACAVVVAYAPVSALLVGGPTLPNIITIVITTDTAIDTSYICC